jgi:uncharacterized LabA/DUF88 family protein
LKYAFIDGHHLILAFKRIQEVHPDAKLDGRCIIKSLGVTKAFFYDAVPTSSENASDEEKAKTEVAAQIALELHERLELAEGFQVREGSTKKDRDTKDKRVQKEVDVMLAVDALSHAFRKNCSEVVLVCADADFIPLVRTLVDAGMFVRLIADPRKVDRTLRRFSDHYQPLSYKVLVGMGNVEGHTVETNPGVRKVRNIDTITTPFKILAGETEIPVYRESGTYFAHLESEDLHTECFDFEVYQRYLKVFHNADLVNATESL